LSPGVDLAASWTGRRQERQLLLACLACLAIGFLLAMGSGYQAGHTLGWSDLEPFYLYGASLAVLHLGLVAVGHRGDQPLVVVTGLLLGVGLLAQARMGAFDARDAVIPPALLLPSAVLGLLVTALALGGGRYRVLGRGPWLWGALAVLLLAGLLVTGQRFRGAIYGAGLITPTEALKVLVLLFAGAFVDRHQKGLARWNSRLPMIPELEPLWRLAAFWGVLAGLLLVQRDLGQVMILSLTLTVILVAGTGRWGYLGYGAAAGAGLGWGLLSLFEHGQRRIQAWLDPFADPTGDSWQVLQGLSGMYAGGLWGEGFGLGNPGYTPIAESDFIYAVIGEELGFVGCVVVVLFFLVLFQRGIAIAGTTRCGLGRLLAIGVTTVLATQTFLNLAGVTKLLPLTGITLPLISRGGASLLTTCILIGLLLAISDRPAAAGRRAGAKAGRTAGRAKRAGPPEAGSPNGRTKGDAPRRKRRPAAT
jgi:cell division protein FtsW (lipid II flippase)